MRRPFLVRLLTVLWALWFGVVLVEPAALQACPMHGGHAAHASRTATHGSNAAGRHDAPSHEGKAACTCLGTCCGSPTVAIALREVAELPPVRIRVVERRTPPLEAESRPTALRYAHPFANGPPGEPAA